MLDAFGRPQSMVVLGGTSEIAGAVVARLAPGCAVVVLAGRDAARLGSCAEAARAAGAGRAETVVFDASAVTTAARTVDECFSAAGEGGVDLVLVAVGRLSSRSAELDASHIADVATATYAWPAAAMGRAAELLVRQGRGRMVVLSSVAGVRVRRANFPYGSAKAGLDGYSLGLADALRGSGVEVQVVRPGFVRTKMTEGLPPAPFATSPEAVADAVVHALGTRAPVVWCPPVLRWVMLGLVHLPAPLWRRVPG